MKRNKEARRIGREIEPYIYLVPTIVLFIFILAIPIFNLIRYSLGDSNIIQGYKGWNQFKNFKYLTSPKFFRSVKVTLIYDLCLLWRFRCCVFWNHYGAGAG